MSLRRAISLAALLANFSVHAADIPSGERRSGYDFMAPDTRSIQNDDTSNPGMLWVLDGEALWGKKEGNTGKSCADCHGDADNSMKGVAARYPAFDKMLSRPIDLDQRINLERTQRQGAPPFAYESRDLLALPPLHGSRAEWRSHRAMIPSFSHSSPRDGSCSNSGSGSSTSPAPTVMKTTGTSGLPGPRSRKRLRGCITGIRAQPYDYSAPELVELELYMMTRAQGMKMELPAVRP
jgi:sulfur-oxidizing protein SoxA